jgi:hypothetical protein
MRFPKQSFTSIRVQKSTAETIKNNRITRNESYDSIIIRIIQIANKKIIKGED